MTSRSQTGISESGLLSSQLTLPETKTNCALRRIPYRKALIRNEKEGRAKARPEVSRRGARSEVLAGYAERRQVLADVLEGRLEL